MHNYFSHSQVACTKLKRMQEDRRDSKGKPVLPKLPVGEVKTRWNSRYLMFERAYDIREYLTQFAEDHGIDYFPTPAQWGLVKKVLSLLGPFFLVTKSVSSNLCMASGIETN